jgi:hypothetical protein
MAPAEVIPGFGPSPVRQALIGIVSDGPKATVAGKIVYSWANGVTVL